MIDRFPHCDQRVLHAPSECRYCDLHPEWQELRQKWGIAFTGHVPPNSTIGRTLFGRSVRSYEVALGDQDRQYPLPCPADFNRPPTGESPDHRRWAGNVATSQEPVNETAASRMMYGCRRPPRGWVCSRTVGHDGPCAASPLAEVVAEARRQPGFMERLRANVAKHSALLDRLR